MNFLFVMMLINISSSFLIPFDPMNEIQIHQLPLCGKCIHATNEGRKCKIFGKRDIITGEIFYRDSSMTRSNSSQCGVEGRFFNKKIPFQ